MSPQGKPKKAYKASFFSFGGGGGGGGRGGSGVTPEGDARDWTKTLYLLFQTLVAQVL